jgi:mono/diheme cytochrome c family protein
MLQRNAAAATTAAAGFTPEQQEQLKEGETVFKSLCQTCHGEDGRGMTVAGTTDGSMMGPPLAGSPRVQGHRDYVIKTLLHGMTGPLAGQTYTQVMLPMGAQNDQWIASLASYVRNSFGNAASFVSPSDVARVRAATASRKSMWTFPELETSLPRALPIEPTWIATASHNVERAPSGLTLQAWTSGAPQEPGMWFQVELPKPISVSEIQFESGPPGGSRGRGGRGGGRGGPAPFGTFPASYQVQVSTDGKSWSKPVAEGKGAGSPTIATFPPVQARFIRVTQTGKNDDGSAWSVLNFRVFTAGR